MSRSIPPYILQELPDISETVNFPIRNIHRIKYTCFDISKILIAFGATSGGIYVFNRRPCEFVQLIPSKDGPITRLSISPDESHIGFTNGKGIVTVTRCDQNLSGYTSHDKHLGNEVTALAWSGHLLYSGDDLGAVCVMELQSFIAKSMFQGSSQMIMSLDSRICQLEAKDCMLLISTLTRCYICNTLREQYRQIGQKLRDGEFGACFATVEKPSVDGTPTNRSTNDLREPNKYNAVDDDEGFVVGEEFANTAIYCARPSSRLWEAAGDGLVRRTHQFKQVLANSPANIVTEESYDNERFELSDNGTAEEARGRAVSFAKIHQLSDVIFSYSKNAMYFLNVDRVEETAWVECEDIAECRVFGDTVYVWRGDGSLASLRFMRIDRFLVQCYSDGKVSLCADLCILFKEYLLTRDVSRRLHSLVGLRDKLQNGDVTKSLENVLEKFSGLKSGDATQLKSGIFVLDNTYRNVQNERPTTTDESAFGPLSPEAVQALRGLTTTVSDKLNTSKKLIKEKWGDFEEKMKYLSGERQEVTPIRGDNEAVTIWVSRDEYDASAPAPGSDVVYRERSHIAENEETIDEFKTCKMLYQCSRLSLVNIQAESSNLKSIIENNTRDMREIYDLMLTLRRYCISINALEDSEFVPNDMFLTYLSTSRDKCDLLDVVIEDEVLYKYFVDSCIAVNVKRQKRPSVGCECGFPLPDVSAGQTPVFSDLIDEFIERQWSGRARERCYEVCRRMPHLWRNILYLRRNEDLINVLRILLQMLDETLLHSFLPQFTMDTWERAVQLYATLYANICLNCNKKFNHISVRDTLSWDYLGSLIIKSVGGRNAIKVMRKYAHLIEMGALTMKFYHTCLLATLYEKYDSTATIPLVDTIYGAYDHRESRAEIHKLLQSISGGAIASTALPLRVAAAAAHWGLALVYRDVSRDSETITNDISVAMTNNNIIDCDLCGLPLQNEVLIQDGGLWVFKCGHTFHGACLNLNKIKLCPSCSVQ